VTVWPDGESQPNTSVLNANTGAVTAAAAIVPAGQPNGGVSVYASDDADMLIDIDGYFAAPATGGLTPYPQLASRVIDTRSSSSGFRGTLTVNVSGSACAPPATASAYVFNATVVPPASLGYLTLWANSQP
jgi:hypothetical protein